MEKKRRKFTEDFKTSVVNELESGKSTAEVSRENNVHPSMLARWKKEHNDNPEGAFKGNGNICKLDAKIEKYERIIGQLYAENEFLKKVSTSLKIRLAEERKQNSRVSA